jgi:hypothetical protein
MAVATAMAAVAAMVVVAPEAVAVVVADMAAAPAMARVAHAAPAATTDKNQRREALTRSKSLPVSDVCHVQKFGSVCVELLIFVVGRLGCRGGAFSVNEKASASSIQ